MAKEFKRCETSILQKEQESTTKTTSLQSSEKGLRLLKDEEHPYRISDYLKPKLDIVSWGENL